MAPIAAFIDRVLRRPDDTHEIARVRDDVRRMMAARPLFAW
jgi:glycine/serine hydroxymethyltransferase